GRPFRAVCCTGGTIMLSNARAPHNKRRLLFLALALLGGAAIFGTAARAQLPHSPPDGSRSPLAPLACSSPSFLPASHHPAAGGPAGIATGDLNLDGNLDLVIANNGSGNVSVLLGTGDGAFGAAT